MRLLSTLFAILFLFSCTDDIDPNDLEKNLNLPDHYEYELVFQCFCAFVGPHRIEIKNDEIVDYEYLNAPGPDQSELDLESYTIKRLTQRVEEILLKNPVREEIELDPTYRFPRRVYFDISENLADEEWGYEISNFRKL